ncbi:hypothetical protein IE53DRAFT_54595 [Violaceomyces palustris]|uniref:Uncharacterized protein n=1 Tax=Violaceomyces palustris TaxID=1673888 RepID=A0ACD0NZY0_9BASI|nr:hypothetical protein IE53DRAFT_54595 [Violaceomyces palustris]
MARLSPPSPSTDEVSCDAGGGKGRLAYGRRWRGFGEFFFFSFFFFSFTFPTHKQSEAYISWTPQQFTSNSGLLVHPSIRPSFLQRPEGKSKREKSRWYIFDNGGRGGTLGHPNSSSASSFLDSSFTERWLARVLPLGHSEGSVVHAR